jgi:DNA-binding NtrC family response regulator
MTPPKPRILFVDDEPSILRSLQHGLSRDRQRWELVFASGSHEALAHLALQRFDVIVSDLKMPGMDGEELLLEVARVYPYVVAILLSGHADAESLPRLRPVLHDLLEKPCPRQHLRAVVESALVEGSTRVRP